MRLIDADALAYEILSEYGADGGTKDVNTIYGMVINAPTIDAEPVKHGKWIEERNITTDGKGYTAYRCSVCQCAVLTKLYNFCPNCGTKMDKK